MESCVPKPQSAATRTGATSARRFAPGGLATTSARLAVQLPPALAALENIVGLDNPPELVGGLLHRPHKAVTLEKRLRPRDIAAIGPEAFTVSFIDRGLPDDSHRSL